MKLEYPPRSGNHVELNSDEESWLRGIYSQQKSGEITEASCVNQVTVFLDLKTRAGAQMLPTDLPVHGRRSAEGDRLRDEGIDRAYDAALGEWKTKAGEALRYVAERRELFTTDAIWAVLDRWEVTRPREPRSMAGVLARGRSKGWCAPRPDLPRVPSVRPEHHSGPLLVWESRL